MTSIDHESILTVGNGEFAFNTDVTGLQSLSDYYEEKDVPLVTMSQWGWHSSRRLEPPHTFTFEDVELTQYRHEDKDVSYAVEMQEGNEDAYNWMRKNPHKFNLGRLALLWKNQPLKPIQLSSINQELVLLKGTINSQFNIEGVPVKVRTVVGQSQDSVSFLIESEALKNGDLSICLAFPYGSHKKSASDWDSQDRHQSELTVRDDSYVIKRTMDDTNYFVSLLSDNQVTLTQVDTHDFVIQTEETTLELTSLFSQEEETSVHSFEENKTESKEKWAAFWNKGGIIDFSSSTDPRAHELERRMVLSLYLIAAQGTGSLPPQETGLTMNSWYGKFHLEMHLWHNAFLPLWGHEELIMPSLKWYKDHLDQAILNAKRNGYKGARWPKMIGFDAIDSPSTIATLLIWQQTHIIYMLELVYKASNDDQLIDDYFEVVEETIEFVCDFFVYDEKTETYHLTGPIIPSQEVYEPMDVKNPTFELEYWRFTLGLAIKWADRKQVSKDKWKEVYERIAKPAIHNGLYLGHEQAKDTFETYNHDHPSMTGMYGLIPNDRIDSQVMADTIDKILDCWEMDTMWGWDFAMMAMTATRLNDPSKAIDLLLMDTSKNHYSKNGHNYQKTRKDLPVYLPGNGSLLLALSLMAAGTEDGMVQSGFPKDSGWTVKHEGIRPFPY